MKRIFFLSDLHARPDEPVRQELFTRFLVRVVRPGDSLYLLGDIFEFGFVFSGRILPHYEPLVQELVNLISCGVEIFFLPGNHDLWMTDYLCGKGFKIVKDGQVKELCARRIQLFHGLLREQDSVSNFASRIMRNPDCVWLYSLLPFKLGFSLALKAAHVSRERHAPFLRRFAASNLKPIDPDAEIVVSGHHHEPLCFFHNDRKFYITGDWIENFSYIEMTENRLELKTFPVNALLGKQGEPLGREAL